MSGKLAIGQQRCRRDFQQGFPDLDLEIRAAQQQMQFSRPRCGGEDAGRQCSGGLVIADEIGGRPVLVQDFKLRRVVIVAKREMANARAVQPNNASPSGVAA